MSRCRETAGILFRQRCKNPSDRSCSKCNKPVCGQHSRSLPGARFECVTCVRETLKTSGKGNNKPRALHHLSDDPYFYWYYWHDDGMSGYTDSDYTLFESDSPSFGDAIADDWQGT